MSVAKAVVKRPVLWLVVFALVSTGGVFLLSGVAVDMFPQMEMPYLAVFTVYPGAGPETVEKSLTDTLESALVNTGGISSMTSTSRDQASIIMLEFDYGANLDEKMNRVRENIDSVRSALPDNAQSPTVMSMKMDSMPIMSIAVRGAAGEQTEGSRSQNELRELAINELQDQIRQIEGVASCEVQGGQDSIVRVSLSQNRLEAYGVTINEIAQTLAAQNIDLGAGSIEDGLVEYSINTSGEFASIADIANTAITRLGGTEIRLQDVGEVTLDYNDETSSAYINGEAGVYLSVIKQSDANSIQVVDEVYKRLDALRETLPNDVSLEVIQDTTTQIRSMINELVNSLISGVLLAVAVLFFFFRSKNSSIIIGLSIPVSFLITLLAMSLAGITLNMMTMTGLILGLGMIVDSSIVVLESTIKYREKGEKLTVAAILAGEEVMSSIIASTITTLCVFVPMILFKNQLEMVGMMMQDMIFTICISLASSLFVAIFLVPVLASKWLPVHSRIQKPLRNKLLAGIDRVIDSGIESVTKGYKRILSSAIKHRLATVLIVVMIFVVSVFAMTRFEIVMMPNMASDSVTLNIEMPQGTTYEETRAVALDMQAFAIEEIKGAKNITASAGGGGNAMQGSGSNSASVTVNLDLENPEADSDMSVMQKFRSHFAVFPNAAFSFSGGRGPNAGSSDIDIVLRNNDMEEALADAENVKWILENDVPEVQDVSLDTNEGLPQIDINIDRQRAYNMGLNIASIAREIAAAMNGVTATTFRQSGNEYDVVLQLAKEDRYEIPDLGNIFVRSNTGALFPVSNFAALEKTQGPVTINHEAQARTMHITADVKEGFRIQDTQNKIKSLLDGQGISADFAGSMMDTQQLLQAFVSVIVLALLLVFGVMAAQYESFRDPFINFCTIPLMVIGVVFIHYITGEAMSLFTMVGVVMLAGIVVNNGIILVDYTNILTRKGTPVNEACIEAGANRFRPVLITTLTTMLGFAPMTFFPGASSEMIAPIGLTLFGGLASATFITLFFVPVLYSLIHSKDKTEVHNEN